MLRVTETLGQVIGNRDRVVAVRVFLERSCDPDPGRRDAQHLAENDPERMNSDRVPHPRQAEEEPGTLASRV